jgi:electron transport complex protein RnfB
MASSADGAGVNRLPPESANLSDAIDAVLPQTQCQRCGYTGCRPYAQAIAAGGVPINRCPPGGTTGIRRLAAITGQPVMTLDPAHGVETPLAIAIIDESLCIGCKVCIRACPVDAIVGAFKQMHTVIAEDCTGCGLCVTPCPVDCIVMRPPDPPRVWATADAIRSRKLHQRRLDRLTHAHPPGTDPLVKADDSRLSGVLERARRKALQRAGQAT